MEGGQNERGGWEQNKKEKRQNEDYPIKTLLTSLNIGISSILWSCLQ